MDEFGAATSENPRPVPNALILTQEVLNSSRDWFFMMSEEEAQQLRVGTCERVRYVQIQLFSHIFFVLDPREFKTLNV